jgi:RNA-splicing ligase RtcB
MMCDVGSRTLGSDCAQERLRQQIEEIKEAEAAYDPNAALAMAMFEHSEARRVD